MTGGPGACGMRQVSVGGIILVVRHQERRRRQVVPRDQQEKKDEPRSRGGGGYSGGEPREHVTQPSRRRQRYEPTRTPEEATKGAVRAVKGDSLTTA